MPEKCRFSKRAALLILLFVILCEILVTLSYERGILAVQHYAMPVAFAFLGMTLLSGRTKVSVDERIALLYPAWYLISRLLLRELYLDDSFYNFCSLCLIYALAFPFAHWAKDEQRKAGLCAVAILFAVAYGILAWIGVMAAVGRQPITLPYLGTAFTIEENGIKRLGMSTHPNVTAGIFFSALVLTIWFAFHFKKHWAILPAVVLGLGLYLAIGLTDSRTVMLQVSVLFAAIVFLSFQRLKIPSQIIRYLIAFGAAAAVLLLTYFSFSAMIEWLNLAYHQMIPNAIAEAADQAAQEMEHLSAGRSVLLAADSLYGRNVHYRGVFKLIAEHPDVLIRGTRVSDLGMVMDYLEGVNAHNSYLQILIDAGIVGLAIAVWFTIRVFWVAVKVVFYHEKRSTFADKVLAVIPVTLLLNAVTESYVFTELKPYYCLIFFLTLGYAIAHERTLRVK